MSQQFSPIAIVGQGCVLPDSRNPEQLWQNLQRQKVCISKADKDYWRVPLSKVLHPEPDATGDQAFCSEGGYVKDYKFDAAGFDSSLFSPSFSASDFDYLLGLDPLFHWGLDSALQAIQSLAVFNQKLKQRTGVILGNLSYPSSSHSALYEKALLKKCLDQQFQGETTPHPDNRYGSSLPAQIISRALGLGGESYCLDAACASGLYALKMACDQLQLGRADLMLAGGVNGADSLFLHVGFTALNALSPSGQSRPFHAGADGLIPAEGAGFIALKRLQDARADGDEILGVIRGIGLSNDGRDGGFLAPSVDGQIRCMQQAYQSSGVKPEHISFVECHATGTATGDGNELTSMQHIFGSERAIALGSLKANLGHLITASGVAGIIKLLKSLEHETLISTPNCDSKNPVFDQCQFYTPNTTQPWPRQETPRLAAVNAFGFGGNNAHVIIQEWDANYCYEKNNTNNESDKNTKIDASINPENRSDTQGRSVALIGVQLQYGGLDTSKSLMDFLNGHHHSSSNDSRQNKPPQTIDTVRLNGRTLAFPPKDLQDCLSQQTLLLQLLEDPCLGIGQLDAKQTGVFVGMEVDSQNNRVGLRIRLDELLRQGGIEVSEPELKDLQDCVATPLTAARVIGGMPNIPANRINNKYSLQGQGFTLSAGEDSGLKALNYALDCISSEQLTSAVVGAVDCCDEELDKIIGPEQGANGAVIWVLKDYQQALQHGDNIIAQIEAVDGTADNLISHRDNLINHRSKPDLSRLYQDYGVSRATKALLEKTVAVLQPTLSDSCLELTAYYSVSTKTPQGKINQQQGSYTGLLNNALPVPQLVLYAGESPQALLAKVTAQEPYSLASDDNRELEQSEYRLGFFVSSAQQFPQLNERAQQQLQSAITSSTPLQQGWLDDICYYSAAQAGELAFCFTGAASTYVGAAKGLLDYYPGLIDPLKAIFGKNLSGYVGALYPELAKLNTQTAGTDDNNTKISRAFNELCGSSLISQLHSIISQQVWRLSPQAVFGLSSGETNGMFALGVWQDLPELFESIWDSGLYQTELAHDYQTVKRFWSLADDESVDWQNWIIFAEASLLSELVDDEPRAYLTIISSAQECVIGGDAEACARVRAALSKRLQRDVPSIPLKHDLACHCPVLGDFTDTWKALHTRDVQPREQIRFYSNFYGRAYSLNKDSVAQALTGQATQTLNLPKIINSAYDDGVRIFIEHGPRNSLSQAIDKTLAPEQLKNCLVISMDLFGSDAVEQLQRNTIQLWCAGITIDLQGFNLYSAQMDANKGPILEFPFRPDPLSLSIQKTLASPIEKPLAFSINSPLESPINSLSDKPMTEETQACYQMAPAPELALLPTNSGGVGKSINQETLSREQSVQAQAINTDAKRSAEDGAVISQQSVASIPELILSMHRQQTDLHQQYLQQQLTSFQQYIKVAELQTSHLYLPLNLPAQEPRQSLSTGSTPQLTEPVQAVVKNVSEQQVSPQQSSEQQLVEQRLVEQRPTAKKSSFTESSEPDVKLKQAEPNNLTEEILAYSPEGPSFSRQDLEVLSAGKISSVFGDVFAGQDHYDIQVRMPEPPLLLCDRVTGIKAVAKSMQLGTVWTETDVTDNSWYTHRGYMPGGVFIEAGQADLLLISYLGVDFLNKGERAYRLLGCELEFLGPLPKVGDTLQYVIHVDGHAQTGDVRLFFFHYDCYINGEKRIAVRNGQAGFFTKQELADSTGVLWSADQAEYSTTALPVATIRQPKASYDSEAISAYLKGDLVGCFGPQFFMTQTHTLTPQSSNGKMNFIEKIDVLDPSGGPAGRGYLKSVAHISPDDWFFEGHFKNDPCMPGTLMAEGCLQMLSFYLIALGYSLDKDGWSFHPLDQQQYKFHCRGQVTPSSNELTYEIFVDEIVVDPYPVIYAHVLCTVDGRKAFMCERLAVALKPDWPLAQYPLPTKTAISASVNASSADKTSVDYQGFAFDTDSLLQCSWGKPTDAFGPKFEVYNQGIRTSRLPGLPYHFMSRIVDLDAEFGNPYNKPSVRVEYDVPADAWYFSDNGCRTIPYCVLMEIALQPCGWLASFCRDNEVYGEELLFRNLDGLNATQHVELAQQAATLVTQVTMVSASRAGPMLINRFEVETYAGQTLIYSYQTAFGFFSPASMISQKGVAISAEDARLLALPANRQLDLTSRPDQFFNTHGPSLPQAKLLMLDRLVAFYPEEGQSGKGYIRAEKDVNPADWFFKAHFFQDAVQPGSLGVEAILQLLQCYLLETADGDDENYDCFEPVIIGEPIEWHYRGQITPDKTLISVDCEISELIEEEGARVVWAKAHVWVDGLKIYALPRIGMRMKKSIKSFPCLSTHAFSVSSQSSAWVLDHCPTYTLPALPFTYLVELGCRASEADLSCHGIHMEKLQVHSWLELTHTSICGQVELIETAEKQFEYRVFKQNTAKKHPLFEAPQLLSAQGKLQFIDSHSELSFPPIEALQRSEQVDLPYAKHEFFHGPHFQLLQQLRLGSNGASAVISSSAIMQSLELPKSICGFVLLDAALQAIPHASLSRWIPELNSDVIGYPYAMENLTLLQTLPEGVELQVEARYSELRDGKFPVTQVWISYENKIYAYFTLVEILVPKGISKNMSAIERYHFICDKQPLAKPTVLEKTQTGYRLDYAEIGYSDWLPGTLDTIYRLPQGLSIKDKTLAILIKEYLGQQQAIHPSAVQINPGLLTNSRYLEQNFSVELSCDRQGWRLHQKPASRIIQPELKDLLAQQGFQADPLIDIVSALGKRFIGDVSFEDYREFQQLGPCIYLANHQVAVESLLFALLVFALKGSKIATVSKAQNADHWLGQLQAGAETLYGDQNPLDILYFERSRPHEFLTLCNDFLQTAESSNRSLFIHVGGTREQYEGQGIDNMSSFIIDAAVKAGIPIVPVAFTGALPAEDTGQKYEWPVHLQGQSYSFGRAIQPSRFERLNTQARIDYFLRHQQQLTKKREALPLDVSLNRRLEETEQSLGLTGEAAMFFNLLSDSQLESGSELAPATQQLLTLLRSGGDISTLDLGGLQCLFTKPS